MDIISHVKPPGDCSPVMHDGCGGITVVDVHTDAVNAFANTSERVLNAFPEHPNEITTEIPRVLAGPGFWRRTAALIGFTPDPRLVALDLWPNRVHWLRWRYEHTDQRQRRQARYRREHELRVKARELARRVESLRVVLAPILGLEPWQVDLTVPVEYANRRSGVEVDEDPEPGDELDQADTGDQEPAKVPPVRLVLPDDFSPGAKIMVHSLISERLLGEWSARWRMDQHPHAAEFTRKLVRPRPPAFVDWELSEDQYSIFVGRSGSEKVYVKTETETPHWGVSAGTGGGKTTTLLLPVIHYRAHGGLVDIIDMKQESFDKSVRGVSGFRVHTDTVSAVTAMAEFLVSAMSVTNAVKRGYPADQIPARVMVIDEFGSFVTFVEIWWKEVLGNKGSSPVFAWFHVGLMQGRTKNHRFVVGTHDFSRETFKGTGPRDLLGTKILVGPISNPKWVTTFGYDYKKVKHQARKVGRGVIGITGMQPEELQIAYAGKDADVRALVSEFEPAPAWFDAGEMAPWITPTDVEIANNAVAIAAFLPGGDYVRGAASPASQLTGDTPGLPDDPEKGLRLVLTAEQQAEREGLQLVGLREALDRGYLMALIREANHRNRDATPDQLTDKALEVMRTARRKDPAFPESKGQRGQELTYLVRDLRQWEANRPSAMRFDDPEASGE
jgi:hypothetical protein